MGLWNETFVVEHRRSQLIGKNSLEKIPKPAFWIYRDIFVICFLKGMKQLFIL